MTDSNPHFERILNILEHHYDYDKGWMANLENLALELSKLINRTPPWSARYLNNLIKGYAGFSISEDIDKALTIQERLNDGQSPLQSRVIGEITVLNVNGVEPGSIVLGQTVRCGYCQVKFVPRSANGKYCCPEHKRLFYNEKRRLKNEL